MTWTFYTKFTQLLLAYTDSHYTWCDHIIQKKKPLKVYSGGIRTSQEASKIIMKHQEGLGNTRKQGDQPRLGGQALQGEQTRQVDQNGHGDHPRLWGQALQKEHAGQGCKLNTVQGQWHKPWLGGGPFRESRLARESRLSSETSPWWEGRLCRESWQVIAHSNRCFYHFNPISPPPQPSWCFLILPGAFWGFLTNPDSLCLFLNLFL